MSKSRRNNRDQRRAREEAGLEKKWREEQRQRAHTRSKKQSAEIAAEIAEDARQEQIYHAALSRVYGELDDDTLRRRIRDLREELLETTSEARDILELLEELQDESMRRLHEQRLS